MTEVKKDSKGRNLRTGESQRADGSYMYRYTDNAGERKTAYSWRLVDTDKTPAGKRDKPPLREQEKAILRDLDEGLRTQKAQKITLNDAFDTYLSINSKLRGSTRNNYKYLWDTFVRQDIGARRIATLRKTDILRFYNKLLEHGFEVSTLRNMHKLVNPALELAVEDMYIRRNPAAGAMKGFKEENKTRKEPLTVGQQEKFISFVAKSDVYRHWLPIFTFMFGTGCRIGETLALSWDHVDFKKNVIRIRNNLLYRPDENRKCRLTITVPKTARGYRDIPMLSDVKRTLINVRKEQLQQGVSNVEIDGISGFVFLNSKGNVHTPENINRAIKRIVAAYNKQETELVKKEKRETELLPSFSPHIIRHTFCTRFCENETNIKVIQEIMGHSDIATTMNIYAAATDDKKKEAIKNLDGKIKIS